MFLRYLATGAVMGINIALPRYAHEMRFISAIVAFLFLPLYGYSPLPLAGQARALSGMLIFVFCICGSAAAGASLVRAWGKRVVEGKRWVEVLFVVALINPLCMVCLVLYQHHRLLVIEWFLLAGLPLVFLGGIWLLGKFIKWLWYVSEPRTTKFSQLGNAFRRLNRG